MIKKIALAVVFVLSAFMATSCGFSQETQEYSTVITETTQDQLAINNGVIQWMIDTLERAKLNGTDTIQVENPKYDPEGEEPKYKRIPTDEVIIGLKKLQDKNEVLAEALSVLDESIQANRGLDPLFKEAKAVLEDDRALALIQVYLKKALDSHLGKDEEPSEEPPTSEPTPPSEGE